MSDQMPPARRRPSQVGAQSVNRPGPRRTGAQRAANGAPARRPSGGAGESKLVCTAGPKAGTEFPLSGDEELVVGRATENVISIPDTSVSRRHCSVRRVEEGWAISDLGSGNGTQVNGEMLEQETVLRNGDVITIGDTELTFADLANATDRRAMPVRRPGADVPSRRSVPGRPDVRARLSRGAPPVADPAKKRKMILIGSAVGVLVVGGLVGGVVLQNKQAAAQAAMEAERQAQINAVREVVQEGKNLILAGNWVEAKAKFEEVKAVAPTFPGLEDFLARANIEIPNQEHLAKAEAFLNQNKLGAASAELKAVKDTQQLAKLRKLKGGLDLKLTERLREASGLVNAGGEKQEQLDAAAQAVAITEDILKVDSEHRDAKIVLENAKKKIADLNYVPPPPPPEPKRPWLAVQARYAAGDMTGALSLADNCSGGFRQCRGLAKNIRTFADLYKKVERLDARGLSKLLALDDDISASRGSPMGRTAGTRAASIFFKNASGAKNAGQYGRAIDWANKCLRADPGNAGCKAVVQDVRGKSKDEYLRCYSLKDTNPDEACSCFRGVKQMTARSDEYHEKADNWAQKLCL